MAYMSIENRSKDMGRQEYHGVKDGIDFDEPMFSYHELYQNW